MPVSVQVSVRSFAVAPTRVRALTETVLALMREPSADVCVSFVGDHRMRRLNHRFRRKDRTTDVLAFAYREGKAPHKFNRTGGNLGDLVIAVPTAQRQANAACRSLEEEIVTLLIHGVLHLCGYDHERGRAEALRMQRKEQAIRRRLGAISRFVHPNQRAHKRISKGT